MRIPLPPLDPSLLQPLYVGDRMRQAGATCVRLLSPTLLVTCSLLGKKLHHVSFHMGQGEAKIITTHGTTGLQGEPVRSDLLDARKTPSGWEYVTANCKDGSVTLYPANQGMWGEGGSPLPLRVPHERADFVHGITFVPGSDLIAATALKNLLVVMDREGNLVQEVTVPFKPKDVCWVQDRIVVFSTEASPSPGPAPLQDGWIYVLDARSFATLGELRVPASQLDGCVATEDGLVYVADQGRDRVLTFALDGPGRSTLRLVGERGGYPMPHGVDVAYGLLAVACYGDDAVHVDDL